MPIPTLYRTIDGTGGSATPALHQFQYVDAFGNAGTLYAPSSATWTVTHTTNSQVVYATGDTVYSIIPAQTFINDLFLNGGYQNMIGGGAIEVARPDQAPAEAGALRQWHAEQRARDRRARELLMENLTEEQRRTFDQHGFFVIEGGKSGVKYRIRKDRGIVANIEVLGADMQPTHRLCAHIDERAGCPFEDHLLAQKLSLELDEEFFVGIANRH